MLLQSDLKKKKPAQKKQLRSRSYHGNEKQTSPNSKLRC